MRRRCCEAVRTRSAFQPALGIWCNSREIQSPWVACSIKVSSVCVSDVVADLCLGSNHIGVTRVVVFGAKAAHREVVQLEVEKAAGEWRTGSLIRNRRF